MTTTLDQIPFGGPANNDFASNPENRCPCLLLLDTSGSMQGQPIAQLNEGLQQFKDELRQDQMASKRVEVAVVTFGPVQVINDFTTADAFAPMELKTTGDTPMGAAIELSVEMIRARKDVYRNNGVLYYRPWIFLITDGAPTDNWHNAARLVHEGEASRSFSFFAVGVQGANMEILTQISAPTRAPLSLRGLQFRELFSWLSNSLSGVSRSQPGASVPVEDPTAGPKGWANV